MKKIGISLIISVILMSITTGVFAAKYDDYGMSIDIPKEYYDLKGGIDSDDAKIEFYTAMMQTSKDELSAEYTQNGVLYNGINSNLANEIFIVATENKLTKSIFHLSEASDDKIEDVKDELKKHDQEGMN